MALKKVAPDFDIDSMTVRDVLALAERLGNAVAVIREAQALMGGSPAPVVVPTVTLTPAPVPRRAQVTTRADADAAMEAADADLDLQVASGRMSPDTAEFMKQARRSPERQRLVAAIREDEAEQ